MTRENSRDASSAKTPAANGFAAQSPARRRSEGRCPGRLGRAALCLLLSAAALLWGARLFGQNGPDADPDSVQGYVDSVFHHGQIDSINLYNGQLTLPIVLGPNYPIGPKLKYQALLTYNSRVWEYGRPVSPDPTLTYAPLVGDTSLGIGWTMTAGAIRPGCKTGPCYEAPDGSEHHFNFSGTRTSDATQLSLHFISSTQGYEMWDGDGNHYVFGWQVQGFDDAGTNYIRDFGKGRDGWYLTSLTDPWGNSMTVTYPTGTAPCWSYTGGSCSLTKMVCAGTSTNLWTPSSITFSGGGSITVNRDPSTHLVTHVIFNSLPVNGVATNVSYDFTYILENHTTWCSGPANTVASMEEIDTISFPGGSYNFDYGNGLLTKVVLPTLGELSYTWGTWSFFHGRVAALSTTCAPLGPPPGIAVVVSPDLPYGPVRAPGLEIPGHPCTSDEPTRYVDTQNGVTARTEKVSSTAAAATTTYTHYAYPYGETGSAPPGSPGGQVLTVVVSPPNVDNVTMAKAVLFWSAPQNLNSAPLPGDRTGADLEERIFDHDPNTTGAPSMPVCGGGSDASICSSFAVRVKRRTFDYDINATPISNRRLQSETTCYGSTTAAGVCNTGKTHTFSFTNNSTCGAGGTTLCTWDADNGRHYNVETHSGNLGNDARTITTKWTASLTPYLPNIFNERVTTQGSYTRDELYEFDAATGFQVTHAIYDAGAARLWLQCRYSSAGNAVNEFTATYPNITPKPPTNVCTWGYPDGWSQVLGLGPFGGGDAFGKQRTFTRGQLLTSQWMDSVRQSNGTYAQQPLYWYSTRYARDGVTGLVTNAYDTGGQVTAYKYDELGRVPSVTPPGETAISVSYDSTTQTTASRGGLAWDRYIYDGLGRLVREIKQTGATSSYAVRTHTFDLAGHESGTSEWASCTSTTADCLTATPAGTTRSLYDPFNRPRLIVGPANATYAAFDRTDGTVPYSDTKEASTTCVNGTWNGSACTSGATTHQRFLDAYGRMTKVIEPTGDQTTYTYDVNDKLRTVSQSGQTRTFTYNIFGHLLQEVTPEKGTVSYTSGTLAEGSLGNILVRVEGTGSSQRQHNYTYDGAGRVTSDSVGTQRYALNCYDGNGSAATALCDDGVTANFSGGSSSGGKITRSLGTNPLFTPLFPSTAAPETVQEDSVYAGIGGRLSDRTTTLLDSAATPHLVGGVSGATESWTYNSIGLVATHSHPRITLRPSDRLKETLVYSYGRLTNLGVSGKDYDTTIMTGITVTPTYRPAGNLGSYSSVINLFATGLTTIVYQDTSGIPRPRQIQSGATGVPPPFLYDSGAMSYDAAGNVTTIGSDTFVYDSLSRLTSANYNGPSQAYTYDKWGNLMTKAGTTFCTTTTPCTNNRIPTAFGATYDTRGNLIGFGSETLTWDDSNRQSKDLNSGVTWQYAYDASDERMVRAPASAPVSLPRREIARYIAQGKPYALSTSCTEGTPFSDVHCNDPDWAYVKAISDAGLTAGCGVGVFCPDQSTPRSQAAVLLLKAKNIVPGACQGTYLDAPCSDPSTPYMEKAVSLGILAICSSGHVCPTANITELDAVKAMADNDLWPTYKPIAGGSLYTLRNSENHLVTEFADSLPLRDNIYIGNILVASYLGKQPGGSGGKWQFHASDHLGTVRLTVDADTVGSQFLESSKYWPYGDRLTPATIPVERVAFAGMERDFENNHFYDHARSEDFNLGRFISPDQIGGRPTDPQSWNRYAYARDNPLVLVDPNGLEWLDGAKWGQRATAAGESVKAAWAHALKIAFIRPKIAEIGVGIHVGKVHAEVKATVLGTADLSKSEAGVSVRTEAGIGIKGTELEYGRYQEVSVKASPEGVETEKTTGSTGSFGDVSADSNGEVSFQGTGFEAGINFGEAAQAFAELANAAGQLVQPSTQEELMREEQQRPELRCNRASDPCQ